MSKRAKRLLKLQQNIKNASFDEVRVVLEDYGFQIDHISGSHHVFRGLVRQQVITLSIPFARPVKPPYIKKVLEVVQLVIEWQKEQGATEDE